MKGLDILLGFFGMAMAVFEAIGLEGCHTLERFVKSLGALRSAIRSHPPEELSSFFIQEKIITMGQAPTYPIIRAMNEICKTEVYKDFQSLMSRKKELKKQHKGKLDEKCGVILSIYQRATAEKARLGKVMMGDIKEEIAAAEKRLRNLRKKKRKAEKEIETCVPPLALLEHPSTDDCLDLAWSLYYKDVTEKGQPPPVKTGATMKKAEDEFLPLARQTLLAQALDKRPVKKAMTAWFRKHILEVEKTEEFS